MLKVCLAVRVAMGLSLCADIALFLFQHIHRIGIFFFYKMGAFFTKCWEKRPDRRLYTRLGEMLKRKAERAPNENENDLTMTTFAAIGEVVALDNFGQVIYAPSMTEEDHNMNMLLHDHVIQQMLRSTSAV